MKKISQIFLSLFIVASILVACSSKSDIYSSEDEEVRIEKEKKLKHRVNLSTLSYQEASYAIEAQGNGTYLVNPSEGLIWEYSIHKDDPEYEEFMEEMDYFINTRGFELKEEDARFVIIGEVEKI